MGHREDLLEGAQRCLLAKGFARTTARDVVKESGANLASIGYHYGSKDALLAQAYVALIEKMDVRAPVAETPDGETAPGSLERFRAVWTKVLDDFPEARAVWLLSFEFLLVGDRMPQAREVLVAAQAQGRSGLLPPFTDLLEESLPEDVVETEGRFYQTVLNGLMLQWLFDPGSATTADQLTEGLRRVLDGVRKAEGD